MKLIVGLGNPGKEYINTRHNIGFMLVDKIAFSKNKSFDKEKFNAKFLEYNYDGEKIIMIKPLSFMNLSGTVVKKYVDFYKIDLNDILIVQDDLDMSFGKVKVVSNSSSGGHNGIKDIENNLGSKNYTRLKIGISNDKNVDTKDYVLGKFSNEDLNILDKVFDNLLDVVEDFCDLKLDVFKGKYNSK